MIKILILTLSYLLCATSADECKTKGDKVLICYYSSWSVYREGYGHFNLTHIDPNLCTHLVYTFAGLDLNSQITSLDYTNDVQRGTYTWFTKLKEDNPCLKTLLAIGGWNEGSRKYSVMSYTEKSRESFADSVLRFLVQYGFDGLDVDWEYPTQRGSIKEDRQNFVELVKVLHKKLKIWNLILTMAVPISKEITQEAYDIPMIAPYVDYVSIMAYDYISVASKVTGLSSPMAPIKEIVDWWLRDIPASKLVLGIATYGRSFQLEDGSSNTGVGATSTGPGAPGNYTKEAGFLSYYELQTKLISNRYKIILTDENTYYAYSNINYEWLTFDLLDTYTKKVEYAMTKGLGGIMVWTLDTDDFLGRYDEESYSVIRTVKQILNN